MPTPVSQLPVFDAHMHIIDPRFPLISNHGYLPAAFTIDDYQRRSQAINIGGGAVVSGSFQGFDQQYLLTALDQLGSEFVGVTQLPADVDEATVVALDQRGVRAIRFNLRRGGSAGRDDLVAVAHRLHDLVGWHVELYIDSPALIELESTIASLPAASIDHLGLSKDSLPVVQRLAEQGVTVKATGFGRVNFDVGAALQAIYQANPAALVFGTDLPSTRAQRPFSENDVTLVVDVLGAGAERVFWDNAAAFYRLGSTT